MKAVDEASGTFRKVGLSADVLDKQLSDLSKKVATPVVDLNDKVAAKNLAEWAVKLDRLSKRVASPKITVEGLHRAQLDILKLDAQLDALNGKEVDVTVDVNTSKGIFSRLGGTLGAGGSRIGKFLSGQWQGTGGWASGGGGGLAGGGAFGGPLGIGALIAAAAALAPAGIPLLLGGAIGGGGALGALSLGSKAHQQLQQLQQSLLSANQAVASAQRSLAQATTGQSRSNARFTLNNATARQQRLQGQIAGLQGSQSGELGVFGAFQDVQKAALRVFSGALTGAGQGFSGGPGGHPGASFLTGLTGILSQVERFIKQIGPGLGDLFRASLPFISEFVKVFERFAKILLPVATNLLNQFAPYLPMLTKGFVYLAKGLAGFLQDLGPGMKDSAIIFVAAAKVTMGFLQLLGASASGFAILIVKTAEAIRAFAKNVPHWFDVMRHETAVIFDGVRHDIAHIWDVIFSNTIGRIERGRHDIAREWDTYRTVTAAAWNLIYSNTIGTVIRLVKSIVKWFQGLPGSIRSALATLGKTLLGIGTGALNALWSGLKSVLPGVLGWLKNTVVGGFKKILSFLTGLSPSGLFYFAGQKMMHQLAAGMKSRVSVAEAAARHATGAIGRAGPGGGAPAANAALARRMMPAWGSGAEWAAWNAVAMRESGWNQFARNPSSGAYGIPQALPPGKMGPAANPPRSNPAAQISWMIGYIRSRYGDPIGAWRHEQSFGWYGGGLTGGIFTRPTIIGVGERGPERVDVTPVSHGRPGGEQRIVLEIRSGAEGRVTAALLEMLRKEIRVRGGSVQRVLGRN